MSDTQDFPHLSSKEIVNNKNTLGHLQKLWFKFHNRIAHFYLFNLISQFCYIGFLSLKRSYIKSYNQSTRNAKIERSNWSSVPLKEIIIKTFDIEFVPKF